MPFAISAGIAAGTTIAAGGIAAVTAGGVAAIVAGTAVAVGLTMTVIGAATGNKGLMQIGGLVGLGGGIVGGLGSLADTAATSAGTSAAGEAAAAGGAPTAEQAAANGAMNTAETTTSTLDGLPSQTNNVFAGGANNAADAAVNSGNQTADFVKSGGTSGMVDNGVNNSVTNAANNILPAPKVLGSTINTPAVASQAAKEATGASTFFDFLKSPSGMQTTGGLLVGLFNAQQLSNQNQLNQGELALNQQNQAYNQNVQSYMLNNANAVAPINMSATPVTQAQVNAQKVNNAANAKQQANVIAG